MSSIKVLCDFNLVPIGTGVSISKYIAECETILKKYGLKTNIHAFGTNIEGNWDTVLNAIKECHLHLHQELEINRILTSLKITTRIDKEQTIDEKIEAVSKHLK